VVTKNPTVGVLALQGDFAEHVELLTSMKADVLLVRKPADLQRCTHLIIPGGESTVIAKLLASTGLDAAIVSRTKAGDLSVLGVCAGSVLVATEVTGKNAPVSLNLLDITVDRNAYGSQIDSFPAALTVRGIAQPVTVSFIRAPVITRAGDDVEILAQHDGAPVLVRAGKVWALTCHPELCGETAIHSLFLRS
jgi:5'-phosphate synthase pdxT subunit